MLATPFYLNSYIFEWMLSSSLIRWWKAWAISNLNIFNMIKVPRIVGVGTDITSVARMIDIIKRSQSIEERFL